MNEQQIKKLVRDEINNERNSSRFRLKGVVQHVHDGLDSAQISEDNVVLTKKIFGFLIEDTTETFSIVGVQNVSRIAFHGIAANNAAGGVATEKALITGEIIFGECNQLIGSGEVINVHTIGTGLPYVQVCNYIYIDTASVANTSVGVAQTSIGNISNPSFIGALAYAANSSNAVAQLSLLSYDGSILKFSCQLASGWKLQGGVTIQ